MNITGKYILDEDDNAVVGATVALHVENRNDLAHRSSGGSNAFGAGPIDSRG